MAIVDSINLDHKFSVGDKVIIRPDIEVGSEGRHYLFLEGMHYLCGNIVTIKKLLKDKCYELIEEDWGWEEDWLMAIEFLNDDLFNL